MPAITAAANPVNAVTSPATNADKSSSGSDASDRPFSSVLAERTKAQQQPDPATRKGSDASSKDETAKTDTADQAAPTGDVASTPIAVPFVPADLLRAIADNSDPAGLADQAQVVGQIVQTLAQPLGGAELSTVPVDLARAPRTQAALPGDGRAATPGPDVSAASREDTPVSAATADLRPATVTPGNPTKAAPETTATPAKIAASQDQIALPTDTNAAKSAETGAVKVDAAMAAANPAMAATAALHAAAANQNNGGSEIRITTPVGSQHWESAVGNSLVVMTGTGREKAELVLTPPQLGRIEVSISMKGDEATAIFVSQNPVVRDAIESALPRLREILADAGITLGQTQVGAESQGQAANERQNGDNSSRRGIVDALGPADTLSGQGSRNGADYRVTSRSLVDTFA